ncbi:MAG: WxcM-like domain-containing protein, partial [Bacteroidales bacterium]
MSLKNVRIIELPKIIDRRGNLSFIESNRHLPFSIERSHWIYDVPGGVARGGHAYRQTEEFIVAMSGSFDVVVSDGKNQKTYALNRSYYGIYIPAGIWREMNNFSTNSLALILSSTRYNPEDYIWEKDELHHKARRKQSAQEMREPALRTPEGNQTSVFDCSILEFEKHLNDCGNLTVVENNRHIPFSCKRAYYLYDVPGGESRGAHAHKNLYQLIIAVGGSFDITLHDGVNTRTVSLNHPYRGLLLPPGIWREITNFSS